MARQSLEKVYADFRLGWVDVASELQQPQGSLRDIDNFNIDIDGALIKRAGMEETGVQSSFTPTTSNPRPISFHIWDNVADDVNRKFLMINYEGNRYRIFDISDGTIDLSSSNQKGSFTINASNAVTNDSQARVSSTPAVGKLFVANSGHEPVVFSYNTNTDTITFDRLFLEVRDIELWRGPTDDDTGLNRVTDEEISVWHEYNLRNAGWPDRCGVSESEDPTDGVFPNARPYVYARRITGFYPNLAIPFSSGRAGGGNRVEEQVAFSPWAIENDYFGNTVPSVGRLISSINPFTRTGDSYETTTGGAGSTHIKTATNIETAKLTEYPSSIAFYSGRIWYGSNGVYDTVTASAGYTPSEYFRGSKIYFSQTIQDDFTKASKCYQVNDPTAEDINQLLATDGGVISIKESGQIRGMQTLGPALVILSDNGMWRIAGKDFNSFTADSFTVDKISDSSVMSSTAFVATKDRLYTISSEGLFVTGKVGSFSDISHQDISSPKIKKFFYQLSESTVSSSVLRYDDKRNTLFCFMNIPDVGEIFDPTTFNTILVYNEDLDCFYKYSIFPPDEYTFVDAILGPDTGAEQQLESVTDSSLVDVTDSLGNVVTISTATNIRYIDSSLIMLFVKEDSSGEVTVNRLIGSTFSNATDFTDFGEDYIAYAEIGFDSIGSLVGDRKQAPYVLSYLRRVVQNFTSVVDEQQNVIGFTPIPEVSCKLMYRWDWNSDTEGNNELYRLLRPYIPSFEGEELAYGEDVIKNKSRIRGRGTSLSLYLESPEGKDAQVLGLGVQYVG